MHPSDKAPSDPPAGDGLHAGDAAAATVKLSPSQFPFTQIGELLNEAGKETGVPNEEDDISIEALQALLPAFRIEAKLGVGGMGVVYKAHQTALDRAVAIKLLPVRFSSNPAFVARFQREAKMLARLMHPHIVTVHDFGQTSDGRLYYVMEHVDGVDLWRMNREQRPGVPLAVEIMCQVCDALQFAHDRSVLHRDIKPANILISRNGDVKLADFGIAREVREQQTRLTGSRVIVGTEGYMAPEQLRGEGDHRADLFAVGVSLYETLTGKLPHGAWEKPSRLVGASPQLDEVITRALQHDPGQRHQSATELKTDLERVKTTVTEEHRFSPKNKTVIVIAAVIVLLLLFELVMELLKN